MKHLNSGSCSVASCQASNVVVNIDVLPPPPPSRPRTKSRGRDDGYMHEVDIAPDGENGNEYALLPKETKKLIRRNGPRSPRSAARTANASIPLLIPSLTRHLRRLFLPLLLLLLTLIPTPTLPITARIRARRSSK